MKKLSFIVLLMLLMFILPSGARAIEDTQVETHDIICIYSGVPEEKNSSEYLYSNSFTVAFSYESNGLNPVYTIGESRETVLRYNDKSSNSKECPKYLNAKVETVSSNPLILEFSDTSTGSEHEYKLKEYSEFNEEEITTAAVNETLCYYENGSDNIVLTFIYVNGHLEANRINDYNNDNSKYIFYYADMPNISSKSCPKHMNIIDDHGETKILMFSSSEGKYALKDTRITKTKDFDKLYDGNVLCNYIGSPGGLKISVVTIAYKPEGVSLIPKYIYDYGLESGATYHYDMTDIPTSTNLRCPSNVQLDKGSDSVKVTFKSQEGYQYMLQMGFTNGEVVEEDGILVCTYERQSGNPLKLSFVYKNGILIPKKVQASGFPEPSYKLRYSGKKSSVSVLYKNECPKSFQYYNDGTPYFQFFSDYAQGRFNSMETTSDPLNPNSSSCLSRNKETCADNSSYACMWIEGKNGNPGYCSTDKLQYVVCGDSFDIPYVAPTIFSFAINLLKIGTPIILIITGLITLVKGVAASKEDEIKKAQSALIRKLISAVLVFFVPTMVQFTMLKVSDSFETKSMLSCISCFLNGDCESAYFRVNLNGQEHCYKVNNPTEELDSCPEE